MVRKMDIDLEKIKLEFFKYTKNYDLKNEMLKRKCDHSLRVMEISEQIAKGLELSQDEIKIAILIGLLHDIARFEQYTRYQTFRDIESIDHGNLGAEILQQDICKYIDIRKYDNIIIKAVKNHNKYKIEKLEEKEELFAKIIRDADKIDIFYESVEMFWKGKEEQVEQSTISQKTCEDFRNLIQVKNRENETEVDNIIKVIAFIFDMNFKPSFDILRKKDYINKILNRYKFNDERTRKEIEEIRKIANKYIDEKI